MNNVSNIAQLYLPGFDKPKPNSLSFNKKTDLGQVFTSDKLANFMCNLIEINDNMSILDPCIGPNSFFKNLQTKTKIFLTGIEIDSDLITQSTKHFYKDTDKALLNMNFLNYPISNKFDAIIQNPPYVRQELMMEGENDKNNAINSIKEIGLNIPPKSNLYIYFILKSILHLNKNGCLLAVFYDSWLYSEFGKILKKAFLKFGALETIYHFTKSAFKDAEIGATVIKFVKTTDNNNISYYLLKTLDDITNKSKVSNSPIYIKKNELEIHNFNNKSCVHYDSNMFKPLKAVVSTPIQRGTSAVINKFFINSNKLFPESVPIIKNVCHIKTYNTTNDNAYILSINGSISEQTNKYLNSVKEKIINSPSNKYKAVKKDILSNKNWYKIKLKSSSNFIFNYYLRKNIDFLYNPTKKLSSDNFYNINIDNNELSYLAILNSSFTRLSILNNSRSQGNGLRKIQLYEFKEIKIFDSEKLSIRTINKLKELGECLLILNRYKNDQQEIIKQIDSILLTEYNEQNNLKIDIEKLLNEIKGYF